MRLPPSSLLLGSVGIWSIVLGIYFALLRPALLAEDLRYIAASSALSTSAVPGLGAWLKLVFIVLGGFAASFGLAFAYLAIWILPARPRGAGFVVATVTLAGPVLMSAVNFALHSDFRWLLLAPAASGIAGILCYLREH